MVEKTPMAGWWPEFFEPLRQVGERVADWFTPRSDAASVADAYHINIELPGVSEKDIDIQLHDGVMTVQGEKKMERTEEKPGYFFSERQYGRFQRTFRLPDPSPRCVGSDPRRPAIGCGIARKVLESSAARYLTTLD